MIITGEELILMAGHRSLLMSRNSCIKINLVLYTNVMEEHNYCESFPAIMHIKKKDGSPELMFEGLIDCAQHYPISRNLILSQFSKLQYHAHHCSGGIITITFLCMHLILF